jgi:beta-glucosidase
MKSLLLPVFLTITILLFVASTGSAGTMKKTQTIDQRVRALLSKMTLEEKVGQMTQVTITVISKGTEPHELDPKKLEEALRKYHVGSILNVETSAYTLEHWHEIITQIQDVATKKTRLGISVLYGIDAIHGANYTLGATIFPQSIAMAATWNPELVQREGEITAYEVRASGIPWNFNPVLDIGRQPLWPRLFETYGEDVYLASTMARAYVKGLQGDDLGAPTKVAACLKHYVGYSLPLSGRDRTQAWIPERMLREYFLPTFQAGIETGARTVMVNSAEIAGIPVHADHFLLTKVLRGEMKFKGFVVSDWEDIKRLHTRDRVADSPKEAVRMAVMAGVDMSMVPLDFSFYELLLELVKEKSVPMTRIDEAVSRILKVKFELGLFEHPYPNTSLKSEFASQAFSDANLEAAREAITLLKNEGNALPLSKNAKVVVTGPTAASLSVLNGGWTITWQGDSDSLYPKNKLNILQAIQAKVGAEKVTYLPGTTMDSIIDIAAVVNAVKESDAAIVCLGEKAYCETPGNIDNLTLEEAQLTLAAEVIKTGKPVILVLVEGRPRIINRIADGATAIVMGYLPGMEGGRAIADVLFGDFNPCGKLPITYPRHPNALMCYDQKPLDSASGINTYDPQFPFGHGLSYTTYEYRDLKLSHEIMKRSQKLTVSVAVKNTGTKAGKEVVQMYVTDLYGSVSRPVKQLKRFAKIFLEPGQEHIVTFTLEASDLSFIGRENKRIVEPGQFRITVANRSKEFTLK